VVVTVSAVGGHTDKLIQMAKSVSSSPDLRELDVLLSTGELQSCALVAMALRGIGKKAISLNGAQAGIVTDSSYGFAKITSIDSARIRRELELGNIVIVAGFQGITEEKDVTTLGRGASDLTAVALAAVLNAQRCEIYTDVDGIYTGDPELIPDARLLSEISFEDMLEFSSHGAKMNPRSIELAMVYDVPIVVASSFTDSPGTLIHGGVQMDSIVGEIRNKVVGVTSENQVAKVTVYSVTDRPGVAAAIFDPLAEAGISVDVIVQNSSISGTTDLTFTVMESDLDKATEVLEKIIPALGGGRIGTSRGLAKISVVGTGMQNSPGYASRMFRALSDNNTNIEMITTSEIRITCIVKEESSESAARAIHSAFDLDKAV
jgi:aspartate kinase